MLRVISSKLSQRTSGDLSVPSPEKKTCSRCHGEKLISVTLKDRNNPHHGLGIQHIIGCPMCDGKGYIDQSDRDRYYRGMGIDIGSKLSQRTPGDLSIPGSDQDVLQPYKSIGRFVGREFKKRQQEKLRNKPYKWLARYETLRDPVHGICPNCGKPKSVNERGTPFCPTPECNMTRPRFT